MNNAVKFSFSLHCHPTPFPAFALFSLLRLSYPTLMHRQSSGRVERGLDIEFSRPIPPVVGLRSRWRLQSCTYCWEKANKLLHAEPFDRECFFSGEWADSIQRSRKGLDPDDLDAIKSFRSWADVQHVLKSDSPSVFRIKPALSHLHHFAGFFETKLGPQLDASFFWGTLGCLLQVCGLEIAGIKLLD